MKIQFYNFDHDLFPSPDYITVLEIENKKLFGNIVQSFYSRIVGKEALEEIFLSEGDENLRFDRNAIYISDPLQINFHDKKIQTFLCEKFNNIYCLDHEKQIQVENQYCKLIEIIRQILDEVDIEIDYSYQLDLNKLLKLIDIRISEDDTSTPLEKLTSFLEILSNLKLYNLVVFCNLKSYFAEEDLAELYKLILYLKIPVILLESTLKPILKGERKLIIDMDFDEFLEEG